MQNPIDLQPTLEGKQVIVRPVREHDWEQMYEVASDPAVWALHPDKDRYKEDVFRRYFDGAMSSASAFSIIDRDTGKVCGSSRFHGHDVSRREIEIGWTFLGLKYWGGVYNAEVKSLMLGHAFKFVDTVVFWVGETNARSRKAVEKIGGVLRPGVQLRALSAGNAHVVYEITKEIWEHS